jgi:hypothetical protein
MKKILAFVLVMFGLLTVRPVLAAGPMLKLSPSSGTYTNGSTFTVTMGVDSGTEKSQGVDAWVTFDASKLEVVSIEKAANPAFAFALGKNIYNDTGKFDVSCTSTDTGTYEATVLSGDLVVITFKAKATGTANVNFTCSAGSTIDSNIFNMSANDVINCASNVGGVYTINDGGSGSTDPTAAPTTAATTTSEELPQTGGVGTTIGLLIFGIVGVLSSLALRFL